MSAAEVRYNATKEKWQEAASSARTEKENAKTAYNEDKDAGLTNNKFEQWYNQNYPSFVEALQNFAAAEAAYKAAYAQYNQAGLQEFERKYQREYKDLYYGSPEGSDDHFSNCLIITPE